MKLNRFAKTAVVTTGAAAFALAAVSGTAIADDKKKSKKEKCYGIVAKGMNDCAAPGHSCAGQAKVDNHPQEWIYVPAGMCDRIAGGKKTPGNA